jgi:hypothetical protein
MKETVAMAKPSARTITLTPAKAQKLMDSRGANRNVSKTHVEYLKGCIERGEWVDGTSVVAISPSGELLDGQHRCAAVVDSGKSIKVIQLTTDPIFKQAVDTGRARNFADTLKIEGYSDANNLGAVVRLHYLAKKYGSDRLYLPVPIGGKPSHFQLMAHLKKNKWLTEAVQDNHVWRRSAYLGRLMTFSLQTVMFSLFAEDDRDAALLFFETLGKNSGDPNDPAHSLRIRLENLHDRYRKASGVGKDRRMIAALMIKAWNLHMAGEKIKPAGLTWRPGRGEKFPEILKGGVN